MITLALDTALGACSVALVDKARQVALSEPMLRGHQERLAGMAKAVMAEAGLPFAALERIGVSVGPGSFTGVRVGVAFAKGLSAALSIPCVGVTTLEALAAEGGDGPLLAVVDGRRDVYVQAFDDGRAVAEPLALSIEDARGYCIAALGNRQIRLIGTGAERLADLFPDARIDQRDAASPIQIAAIASRRAAEDIRANPVYLRAPDARTLAERGV